MYTYQLILVYLYSIGLAKIQLEEGMSFCDWVPVKVEDTYIPGKVSSRQSSNDRPATEANSSSPMDNLSDRPDFDDIEVMVEISVLSPTAECTRRAPESMSDSYLFERTITGIPIPLTLSADESNLAEGINTIVNESGLRDDTLGQSFCTNEVLHGQTSIALKNFDCLSYAALDHDYRCAISSAYNWMWQIGFNGTDPLAIAPEFSNISSGHGDLTTNTEAHIAAGRVSFVEQLVNSEFAKEPFNSLNNLPDSDDEEFYSHEDHRTSTLRAPFDLLNEVDQLENRHDSFDEYCDRDFESLSYMVENGRNTLFMDSKQYLSNFSFSYKPTKQLEEASNVQVTSKRQLPVEGTDDLLFVDELVPDSVNKVSALQLPPGEDQTSPSQCANSEESFMEANNCSAINNMMQGYSLIEVMGGANNVHANLADCSQGASVTSHVAPGHENTNCESRYLVQQRVDCPYPLQWITEHLNDLEELVMEMRSLLSEMNVLINKGVTFRPSTLKKEIYYQAIPINLHYQLLSVKAHSSNKPFTDVVHSLTCGAMSPHYLGHKNGGLFFQEMELVVKREEIERLKASYLCLTEEAKMKGLQLDERYGIGAEAFTVLSSLRSIVTAFEKSCLQLGRRRVYAIAQAVSIAVNCVLLKLALVREGTIPFQVAERWVQDGFLIVFEGLLSVVGHERSMLEDTMSAVDALRSYQVRILSNEFLMNRRHGRCAGSGLNNEANENKYDNQDKTSDHTFQKIDGVEVEMSGREVVIYLSEELLSQLPESYRLQAQSRSSFGTVLHLVPVLFTQVRPI